MAIQILDRNDPRFPQGGPDIDNDRLARQKIEHARKVDEREEFVKETVTISTGPKNTAANVVVKYPRSAQIVEHKDDLGNVERRERVWTKGRFAFAVYSDNPDWHKAARDEWEAGAKNGLEKFAAMRGCEIIHGPRPEHTNRYNVMVEFREPIQ